MVHEYVGTGDDHVKNREGFTEVLGDVLFTIPAIKAANAHRGMLFTKDYAKLSFNIYCHALVINKVSSTHVSTTRCRSPCVPV